MFSTNSTGNYSNATNAFSSETVIEIYVIPESLKIFFSVIYYSIAIFSVFGNSLIIVAVVWNKHMQNVTNIFIINLAIADIIISLFSTPFQFQAAILQRWIWSDFFCKLGPFALNINITVSVLTLVAISIDRFHVIIYPLKPKLRKKGCIFIIFSIWIIGILLSVYSLINYHLAPQEGTNIIQCTYNDENYVKIQLYLSAILQFIIPLMVITFTALVIYHRIYNDNAPFSPNSKQTKNKQKVIKMIFIVVCMFTICWTPLQTYLLAQTINTNINQFYYINVIWLTANWFAMSNSCYNVLIYGACSTRFKQEFKKILCFKWAKNKEKYYNKVELQTSCTTNGKLGTNQQITNQTELQT